MMELVNFPVRRDNCWSKNDSVFQQGDQGMICKWWKGHENETLLYKLAAAWITWTLAELLHGLPESFQQINWTVSAKAWKKGAVLQQIRIFWEKRVTLLSYYTDSLSSWKKLSNLLELLENLLSNSLTDWLTNSLTHSLTHSLISHLTITTPNL